MTTASPDTTTIYLIRHAQVDNPQRLLYGHLPGFGLSREGMRQARALGRGLRSEGITAIYTSPLERTRETALLVQESLHPRPPLIVRSIFRENEVTRLWQGTPYYRIPFRFPRQYLAWVHHPQRITFSENTVQLAKRVDEGLLGVVAKHAGEAVLVMSHSTPIQAWAFWRRHRSWRRFHGSRIRNAHGYRVVFEGRELRSITRL